MDFLFDPGFERPQHQPKFQVDMEVAFSQVQVPLHTTALEAQVITLPLIVHIELLRQILCQGFGSLTGMIFIKGMGAMDINNGHGSGFSGN
ncbi:MAG: hypothetical protein HLUCCO03_00025 [Marinobacter sp. HL-58]|nr:MAG: hypothetical protein HLUCCO03_00025 [Marinobacter sp. HL-58]